MPQLSILSEEDEEQQEYPAIGTRGAAPGEPITNPDGSQSSERTMSFEKDGKEYLIPTIVPDDEGYLVKHSNEDAIALHNQGKNPEVGVFDTPEQATEFAKQRSESGGRASQIKAPEPVSLSLVGEERDPVARIELVGSPDEPGFFSRAFDSFQDWRETLKPQRRFTREEAREITKQNIKRNREMFGGKGGGQFSFGESRPAPHSALVRAGLEEPPEDPVEVALTDALRGDPDIPSAAPVRPSFTAGKGPEFGEEQPKEDPWGTVIWDTLTNVPAMFKRQYGGAKMFLNAPRDLAYILESAADEGVAPEDSFANEVEAYVQGKDPTDYYKELLVTAEENVDLQEGMRMHKEATDYLQAYAPKVKEDSAKYYASAIIEGAINMGPALVTTAVTRNPSLGAAMMGGQVFADQYADSIGRGRSHSQAVMDGTVNAAAEILTERIPLGILTSQGGSLLKRFFKSGGAEAIQEPVTQLIQEAYSKAIINDEMTFGEAIIEITTTKEGLAMLRRSAIVGFGVGGTLATAVHPFYKDVAEEVGPDGEPGWVDLPETGPGGKPLAKKPVVARMPSEESGAISDSEAAQMGLRKVDIDQDVLERAATGDPLTVDEQYTLTNEGYGKFISDGDAIMILPKGKRALSGFREAAEAAEAAVPEEEPRLRLRGREDEAYAREGRPERLQRQQVRLYAGEQLSNKNLSTERVVVPARLQDIVGELPEIKGVKTKKVANQWVLDMRQRLKQAFPALSEIAMETAFLEDQGIGTVFQAMRTKTSQNTSLRNVNGILAAADALIEKYDMVREGVEPAIVAEEADISPTETFRADTAETKTSVRERRQAVRRRVAEVKTKDQIKQGTYRKGHMRVDSLPLTIETTKGQKRSGVDEQGRRWSLKMQDDYGYIKGTKSKEPDGRGGFDQVDAFIGEYPESSQVVVINQKKDPDLPLSPKNFDEHKVMIAYRNTDEAIQAYRRNYSDEGALLGSAVAMTTTELREWLETANTKRMAVVDGMETTVDNVTVVTTDASAAATPEGRDELSPQSVEEGGVSYDINQTMLSTAPGVGTRETLQVFTDTQQDAEKFESPEVKLVETGVFKSGLKVVKTAEQVAHLVAPLRREAQESLMGVVTNRNGKALAVIRHSVGTTDSAPVHLSIFLGAMHNIPGARNVWMVHQHPSAETKQSSADVFLAGKFRRAIKGTGIAWKGSVVVTPGGGASFLAPDSDVSRDITIEPLARTQDIPIVERRFKKFGRPGRSVTSPMDVQAFAATLSPGEHAVLLDTRHKILAVVPVENLGELRTKDSKSGAGKILAAAANTNASAIFFTAHGRENGQNALAFADEVGLRGLDATVDTDRSMVLSQMPGFQDRPTTYFHRRPERFARLRDTNAGRGVTRDQVQAALRPIYSAFRTVPPVRVVQSIEDLPSHLQTALDDEHSKRNTTGMYDQGAWKDDIYIIANNVTDTAEAIETMMHEVVGHFGLRQVIDPHRFDAFMDRVSKSFEKDVREIANSYDLSWDNISERRIASEEFIAHTAQRVLMGKTVSERAKEILDAIVQAIANMIRVITGQKAMFTNGQLTSIIAQSSTFVQTPGGYQRSKRRGALRHMSSPYYYSQVFEAFNNSETKATSPDGWRQFIKSQIKAGKMRQIELDWLGLDEFLEELTWNDVYQMAGDQYNRSADRIPDLEGIFPRPQFELLVEHRELGRKVKMLKDQDERLRQQEANRQLGFQEADIDYQKRRVRDELLKEIESQLSTNEQRDLAVLEEQHDAMGEDLHTFGQTRPKKIPKSTIMSAIARQGVDIEMYMPSDEESYLEFNEEYPDETEEPDEDAWMEAWDDIRGGHWNDFYPDALREVHQDHNWDPDLEADPDIEAEEDMDLEELNEVAGWDGTSEDDMEMEATEKAEEAIEGEYYEQEREEWEQKNTSKRWYSGDYHIQTDSDGDYVVSNMDDGSEHGYYSSFDDAVNAAEEASTETQGGRWKEYVLDPKGEDYFEYLFKWTNPVGGGYSSSGHWGDEEDMVAHARGDIRKDPNGEDAIYVDELQSDWHQEIRDVVKRRLTDIQQDHEYDPNYANSDGSIGGGPEWDGTPPEDMMAEARKDALKNPAEAKRQMEIAKVELDKLKESRDKILAEMKAWPMNVGIAEMLEPLADGPYSSVGRTWVQSYRSKLHERKEAAEQGLLDMEVQIQDEIYEKHGFYAGLTEPQNIAFAAYRVVRKGERGQQMDSGLISQVEFADFVMKQAQEFGMGVTAFKDTGDMLEPVSWMDDLWNVKDLTGLQASHRWGKDANTVPKDLPDWDRTDFKALEKDVREAAFERLSDPEDTSTRAKMFRERRAGDHIQAAWTEVMANLTTHDYGHESATAAEIYKVWVTLAEAMEKISEGSRNVTGRTPQKTLDDIGLEFEYSFDAKLGKSMRATILDFVEAQEKGTRYQRGMSFAPFEKDWQLLVMKGLIAEGVRNGHDRIYLSKGEVHGVRWSGSNAVEEIQYFREIIAKDDKTIDMFTGEPRDIKKPGSLQITIAVPGAGGRSIETNAKELRMIVGDRVARHILTHDDDIGFVNGGDVNQDKIILPSESSGQRITGSRLIYNVITPQMLNKFLKKFKAKVVDSWVPGSENENQRQQTAQQGLAVKTGPGKDYERWKKSRVRRLTTDEVVAHVSGGTTSKLYKDAWGAREVAPENRGIWAVEIPTKEDPDVYVLAPFGNYHPNRFAAQEALDEALKTAVQRAWGYEAWEIEFTDKLKEAAEDQGFPLFSKRKKLTGDPGLDDALKWANKNIGPKGPRSIERLQERINSVLRIEDKQVKTEQAMLDQFAGLKWAIRQTHGHDLPAQTSSYKQAHFTTSMDSQMYYFLTHGVPHWQEITAEGATGTVTQIKPGTKGLLEVLEPVTDKITYWGYWMAARRANRLLKEGREALFTQERVDELLKLGERFPEFQGVADAYNDWKTQFLDWASEAGVINEDTRPLWDMADYVPFYRIKSDEMGGSFAKRAGMGGPGIANVAQPIKRLRGAKHPLGDILENIIVNFQHIATTTMKNKAAQLAIENLTDSGLITPAKGMDFMKQEFIPMDELKRKLKQAGVDWEAMPEKALQAMQKMWTLQRPQGDQFISVLYNGKKKWFEVHEETLLRSLTAINEKKFASVIGRVFMWPFRKFKRLGTTMITLAPDFMAANWFRDLFMAFTNSRHAKMPKPFSGISGAWKALSKSPEMVSIAAAGGAFYSGYINANDPVATVKAMKRALRQTGFKNRILDSPWKLFHFYNDIGAASENANRIGSAYIPAIKADVGIAEAVWESKDLMNFAKHGDHALMQFFAQSVMFLNARIQGLVRYGQRFKEAPGITFTKSMMYSMAVLAIWLKNKDDDRYKALPEEEKDMYVHFWPNGKHWRLPKAFEVGMIFGVGVERMFEYFYSNEDDAGKVAIDRLWFVFGEVFNFFNRETIVPLPQAVQPLFEATNNWNAFFQSPIVPEYMQDIAEVKPEIVFRSQTSPTMRELANGMPKFAPGTLRNPLLLEHLVRGYLGTLGAYAMMMSDDLVRKQFDYPPRPELRWSKTPVAGRFYRGEDVPSRSMFEEVMYEVRNNARQIERAVNQLERLEMEDEVDVFMEEPSKYDPTFTNQQVVDAAKAMESSYQQIKTLRRDTNDLWEDEEMTPEQKGRELNQLYQEKLELSKDAWLERPGAEIQFEALQDTLIDMIPEDRVDYLVEQGLENTADLLVAMPRKPSSRLKRIMLENSA